MMTMTISRVVEVEDDLCDACPAGAKVRAYVYADLDSGTLGYCGHHGTKYWDELNRQANFVIDLRHQVLA